LGIQEAFTIEQAVQTLRRRVMEEQNLPYATPASLTSRNLAPIEHWPRDAYFDREGHEPQEVFPALDLKLTLLDALRVAALNSRSFQNEKEEVFRAALALELQRDEFRTMLSGFLEGEWSTDRTGAGDPLVGVTTGVEGSGALGATQKFLNGMVLSLELGLDIARLYSPARLSSRSAFAEGSLTVPLLRGRGRHIVGEPLTQAQRDLLYAVYEFERFKRSFAVDVASQYLAVLQSEDQVTNAGSNYVGLIASARRARRLADAGNLPEIQVDQAIQDELRARDRWVSARENAARLLDAFKLVLGLPPDASVELDRADLSRLAETLRTLTEAEIATRDAEPIPPADAPIKLREPTSEGAGPLEMEAEDAVELALQHRLDLKVAQGRVDDAMRAVVVAADALRAELTLLGSASTGEHRGLSSVSLPNTSDLDLDKGIYSALLTLDLPFERTAEAIAYRESLIALERAVRALQAVEDQTKLDVRNGLSDLLVAREGLQIQAQAIRLAERRVHSTDLFLQAGRVEIRDLLEAQEALLNAQNALTSAMVNYRVSELGLQRDLGLLQVDETGTWSEFRREVEAPVAAREEERSHVQSLID
jgi:outer membrane protein TolC